jgi:hypothetical protein
MTRHGGRLVLVSRRIGSASLPINADYCDGSSWLSRFLFRSDGDKRPRDDPVEPIGLSRLEGDQAAKLTTVRPGPRGAGTV